MSYFAATGTPILGDVSSVLEPEWAALFRLQRQKQCTFSDIHLVLNLLTYLVASWLPAQFLTYNCQQRSTADERKLK